jgi:hypothetical protein
MNQLYKIFPYRTEDGGWSFDDQSVGLYQEPFVLGVPEIIDSLVGDATKISILFSQDEFPEITTKFTFMKEDMMGAWYREEKTRKVGWLCPALKKYYSTLPETIYIKIERLD